MKFQVEVDCTPEEARTFLGFPDVSKANAVYVDAVSKAMKGVSDVGQLQDVAKHSVDDGPDVAVLKIQMHPFAIGADGDRGP